MQRVEVEPHTRYRLAGWIRTEDVVPGTGRGAFLNVQEIQDVKTQGHHRHERLGASGDGLRQRPARDRFK